MTSRIGALIVVDREKAKAEILAAIDDAKGNRTHAAKALGVPFTTLHNWIRRLELWPTIDELCSFKGYEVPLGAPRKKQ
jgi:transcriptional regulator with GAF, ATPase, and Fis domain